MENQSKAIGSVLTGSKNWKLWLERVKSIMEACDVWDYMDPSQETQPKLPKTWADITRPQNMDDEDAKEFQKDQFKTYRNNYVKMHSSLMASIDPKLIQDLQHCTTPYKVLHTLQGWFQVTDDQERKQIASEVSAARIRGISRQGLESYLNNMGSLYERCVMYGTSYKDPEFIEIILEALQRYNNGLYNIVYGWTLDQDTITIAQLLARIRKVSHGYKHTSTEANHATITSPQATEPQNPTKGSKRGKNKGPFKCLRDCGEVHWWGECKYLNYEGLGLKKPDDDKMTKITKHLADNPGFKAKIEASVARFNENRKQQAQSNNTSPPTQKSEDPVIEGVNLAILGLANDDDVRATPTISAQVYAQAVEEDIKGFLVDSGSTGHVCYDKSLFIEITPEDTAIRLGDGLSPIKGRGKVRFDVRHVSGRLIPLTLNNVLYAPNFHIHILSVAAIIDADMDISFKRNMLLDHNGSDMIPIARNDKLWTMPIADQIVAQNYAASSYRKPASKASITTWHRRLGHINDADMLHIPNHTEGAKFDSDTDLKAQLRTTTTSLSPKSMATPQICEVCAKAKIMSNISRVPALRSKTPFAVISADLIIPSRDDEYAGYDDSTCLLHIIDQATGYRVSIPMRSREKQPVVMAVDHICNLIDSQYGYRPQIIHIDGEGALKSKPFLAWAAWRTIQLSASIPYAHEQNGAAEKSGQTIETYARALAIESGFPPSLWPEMMVTATRLLNITPKDKLGGFTPYELLYRRKPHIGHIRIIGSKVYVNIPPERRQRGDKLGERATIGWLVGQESHSIHRVWDCDKNRVLRVRDALIDEAVLYRHRDTKIDRIEATLEELPVPITLDDVVDEIHTSEGTHSITASRNTAESIESQKTHFHAVTASMQASGLLTPSPSSPEPSTSREATPAQTSPERPIPDQNHTQIPSTDGEATNQAPVPETQPSLPNPAQADGNSSPPTQPAAAQRRARDTSQGINPTNILREPRTRQPRKPFDALNAFLASDAWQEECYHVQDPVPIGNTSISGHTGPTHHSHTHISRAPRKPSSHVEAMRHEYVEKWQAAEKAEIESWKEMHVYSETPWLPEYNVIPLKWVYTYKLDLDDFIIKFKARLVARGDLAPIPNDDVYACTLAYKTFRILLALITYFGLDTVQLDVVKAYLNALLPPHEEIYLKPPPGFGKDNVCWQAHRAIYGLASSARLWYEELAATLKSFGFRSIPEDMCLFIHNNKLIFIFVYVDDIVIAALPALRHDMDQIRRGLATRYKLHEVGPLRSFLNLHVIRDVENKKSWLSQTAYIEAICRQYHCTSETVWTPLSTSQRLDVAITDPSPSLVKEYQKLIGKLLYPAIISRPDIAYAVGLLARYSHRPAQHHLEAAKRVLNYLYTTRFLAIEYSATPPQDITEMTSRDVHNWLSQELIAASDAAYADDPATRKSTQGFLIKLFNGPIHWQSVRQKTVTTSTTEAELISLSTIAKEILVIQRLFKQLYVTLESDIVLGCDNQQTIRAVTAGDIEFHTKLKHIDIHHFWLRQEIQTGRLHVTWIPTSHMPADGLTKVLDKNKHKQFCKQLNLIDISDFLIGK
jgi:hypothetical protein